MASFDLSVLTTLQEKFGVLEEEIKRKQELIQKYTQEQESLQGKIQNLESEKVSTEIKLNGAKEEFLKLNQRYEEITKQYETVKESASKLLNFFDS